MLESPKPNESQLNIHELNELAMQGMTAADEGRLEEAKEVLARLDARAQSEAATNPGSKVAEAARDYAEELDKRIVAKKQKE